MPALHSNQWESRLLHLDYFIQSNRKLEQSCRFWKSPGSLIPDFASVNTASVDFSFHPQLMYCSINRFPYNLPRWKLFNFCFLSNRFFSQAMPLAPEVEWKHFKSARRKGKLPSSQIFIQKMKKKLIPRKNRFQGEYD